MRLVCKAWYRFVNDWGSRKELCVYHQVVPHKLKWNSDGCYVRDAIKVKISELNFKDPYLQNLKRLFIYKIICKIQNPGLLNSLNSLTNLEEVKVGQ